MKRILLIACFLIGGIGMTNAQQTSPVWPGCEDAEDVGDCFNQKLSAHVSQNYQYPMNDNNEYVRGEVKISFDVTEEGKIKINSIEGDKPEVKQAAREMINKIPKMKPGTLNGEPDARTFTSTYRF
ncbi:energy transducer TonB [Salinimicrobium sp. GXAS 041]|uniref:energy transducer TonB n=1 Tax=Salinimicrobium sp. GXAS 041 TaxID=3400806 RepID=UPI003C776F33